MRLSAPERRIQILDVALGVFSRRGYHGASMNDVAEAAGVSKPVLYQHFGSKEELYVSLVGEVGNRLSRAVSEAIPTGTDPRSRIIAGLGAYFGFVAAHRDEFRLLFGSGTTREGALATGGRDVERLLARTIAGLLGTTLPADRRLLVAHGIVGLAEGTCRHWLASDLQLDPTELATEVGEVVWAGLRTLPLGS